MTNENKRPVRGKNQRLILALSVVGAVGLVLTRKLGLADGDVLQRVMGLIAGVVFVVGGNSLPKTACDSPAAAGCEPAKGQSFRRFAGWFFVLAGSASLVAWLFLPIVHAKTINVVVVAAGALIFARLVWPAIARRGT